MLQSSTATSGTTPLTQPASASASVPAELPPDHLGTAVDQASALASLEGLSPLERVRWAYDTFGEAFALTTSFGIQSAVMLHLTSQVSRSIPVIWVDTGYLHPETYRYAADLSDLLVASLREADLEIRRRGSGAAGKRSHSYRQRGGG